MDKNFVYSWKTCCSLGKSGFIHHESARNSFVEARILLEEESRELKVALPTTDECNERREEVGKNHDLSGQKEVSR